jgi:Ca2+-transporting ATPase
MTTLHRTPQGPVAYAKGTAEVVLDACARRWTPEGALALASEDREAILDCARSMASRALRVLAVARKSTHEIADAESDLEFLGLVGLMDPPRAEARSAIEVCYSAGIRVVMITATARSRPRRSA